MLIADSIHNSSDWCHKQQLCTKVANTWTILLLPSRLERPASPCRICTVTRGFQTTTQDLSVFTFLQDTITWHMCYHYHSSLLSGHLWSLQ